MNHFYARFLTAPKNLFGFCCKKLLIALLAIFCMGTVSAQVSLTLPNSSYAQDFNTLASSGTSSTLPAGWFFIETGTGSNALYTAGTGSGAGGDTYSFGASSSTERALGGLQSGSVVPAYGAAFTNNTGTDISSLVISYTGETWRVAAINRSDRIDFQYSTDATSLTTGTWIDDNVLDYANPGQATGSGSMQHSASLSNSLSINIPNGATIWIRWLDLNVSGSDDGIGIDDFNVSYNNVAPPAGSADIPQSFAIVNFGGPDVYYDLKASTANPDFDGAYLGTFASGGSIWLDGAQNKTEKCGTYDITGNRLYYRIYPTASPTGSYNNINLPWLSNDGGSGGCTDQTWQEAGAGINLLNGLCDGNYTVEVYTVADYTGGSGGTVLANNGGANYKANFSISNPVNSGIFESYAVVNGNFYDLQAATVNADFNGAGLGVYNSLTGSLVVNGGQNKTFKCPPDDITSGALYYRVYPAGSPSGSFTVVNFNWASNDPGALCTGGQNQTWQQTANSTPNLITGLPDGMYSLEIYTDANFNSACGSATHYSNNGGSNYIANFQVGTPPSLTNPGTQNVSAAAGCVAVVNYSATATGTAPIAYSFTFSGATSGSGSGTGSGSTFNLGTTNVSITASNSFGSDVQSFSVVVADNNVPTVITQNATVYLDASGNASITAAQIDNGSSDNCGVQSIAVAPSTFNCTNLAPNASDLLISEYVEGSSNNKAIEIYNGTGAAVNLQDYALRIFTNGASSPSNGIILPNFSLANGATYVIVNNGAGIITTYNLISATVINFNGDDALALVKNPTTTTTGGTFVDIFGRIGEDPGTAWVNLPNTTLDATLRRKSTVINGVNTNPGASFPTLLSEWEVFAQNNISGLGTHSISSVNTVTLTVTDIHGNVASGTANVNVVDNTVPTAPTIADATGECSVTVTAPSATDNCAGSVTGTTTDPTTYNAQGSYTITWTFDDGNGNTSTATQNVIVDDVTAPTAPASLPDATGECAVTLDGPVVIDNCGNSITGTAMDPITGIESTNITIIDQGVTTVTWTFTDASGNSSTVNQTVIIDDVTAPPAPPSLPTLTDECSYTVTTFPTVEDECVKTVEGIPTDPGTGNVLSSLTFNTQGIHTIRWVFDDGNGNTSFTDQDIVIQDVTAPAITCPANITLSSSQATATWTDPTATDNCGAVTVTQTAGPASGSTFAPGSTTTITYTATDAAGLSTSCSFTVTRNVGINVNVTYTPINCYGGWSLVHVTASGGFAPYWGVGYFFVPAGTYNFTVWDSHGQNGTTTVTITQPTPIVVACGTNNPELFFGYSADNTAQILASATGGTPPYKISYSMNRRLKCNVGNSSGDETWVAGAGTATNTYTVCPGSGSYWQPPVSTSTATLGEGDTYSLTVSLMDDAVITATITDANGCVQKCTTPIFATDVRCSGNKVKICHKQGAHGCRTTCVDETAVAAHLAHGDFLGECNSHCHPHDNNPWWGPGWGWWGPGWGWWGWWQGWGWWGPGYGNPNPGNPWGWKGNSNATIATETTKGGVAAPEANDFEIYNLKVAPNPSSTEFVLQVNTTNNTDRMLVNIYDVSGKIYKQFKANPTQLIKFGTGMRPGTYLVEVLQAGHRKTATVIKL